MINKMVAVLVILTVLAAMAMGAALFPALSAAAQLTGDEIMARVDKLINANTGSYVMDLTVARPAQDARTSRIKVFVGGTDKVLVRYLAPAQEKGMGYLRVKDDMWLYLPNAVIKVKNLRKVYHLGEVVHRALDGISLEIDAGEFLAIAGPSGSGKTTLLNIIGCLDSPTEGEVFLGEQNVASLTADQQAKIRKERLGFVFQSYNLIPVLSAFENVEYPLVLNKVNPSERRRRVTEILEEVGLGEKMHNLPNQLSGGQQQRVSIARALVNQPMLVLADEPTANLDSQTGQEIIGLMQRMNREKGATFIFATHDQRIMQHSSRLVEIRDGKIA